MPTYVFKGRNRLNEIVVGERVAADRAALESMLRREQVILTNAREKGREISLPKLGRALGADPTAVYRHFASKDDLVLAIADALIGEATAGVALGDCWVETITEGARRLRSAIGICPGPRKHRPR